MEHRKNLVQWSLVFILIYHHHLVSSYQWVPCDRAEMPCNQWNAEHVCVHDAICSGYVQSSPGAPYFCSLSNSTCISVDCGELQCELMKYEADNPNSPFQVNLFGTDQIPQEALPLFIKSALYWTSVIRTSVPAFQGDDIFDPVDGLGIVVRFIRMDGPQNQLGGATNLLIEVFDQNNNGKDDLIYTRWGLMEFDITDWENRDKENFLTTSQWEIVIKHEMGHIMGIGINWAAWGLIEGSTTCTGKYFGAKANQEYKDLRGLLATVPVETGFSPMTRCYHWREFSLGNELMTGLIDKYNSNPVSRISIASLEDMGHTVDYRYAEPYYKLTSYIRALKEETEPSHESVFRPSMTDLSQKYSTILVDHTGAYKERPDSGITTIVHEFANNDNLTPVTRWSSTSLTQGDMAKLENVRLLLQGKLKMMASTGGT